MKRLLLTTLFIAGAIAAYTSCEEQEQAPEIVKVESVSIDQEDMTLTEGESVTLTATVLPEDAADKTITWSSSNDDVVMIASNGKVKALAVGQAIVMAQAGGKSDFITINVVGQEDNTVPSATVGADHISAVSGTLHGSITSDGLDGHYEYGFMYSTSAAEMVANPTIIKASNLDSNSTYYAVVPRLSPSTTYYYRSYLYKDGENYYGRTKEFTTKDVSSLLETYDPTGVEASKAILNGKLDLKDVSYSNISYGYFYGTSESNLNKFIEGGSISNNTFYTSSLNNLSHNTQYWYRAFVELDYRSFFGEEKTFTTGVVPVTAVALDRSDYTFHTIGNTLILNATVTPNDATDKSIRWSSDNSAVATVNSNGLVTAVGNGNATITVTSNDQSKTASCAITVSQYVTGITLNKTSLTLIIGEDETLSVTAVSPSNAYDKTYTWSSSDESVATVNSNGNVVAVSAGEAQIRATANDGSGVNATCEVTVKAPYKPAPGTAIDLGLSVKWSNCNLGATKPEEYGDYFAWGETEPKENYYWPTYKWGNSSTSLTKYNSINSFGLVDNKTVLDPEDDVAHVKLGGNWRMPTDEEWKELREECTWTWTYNYNGTGITGRIVTATNGNSIFLPTAGYRHGTNLSRVETYGYYWSSSLYTDDPQKAKFMFFYSSVDGQLISFDRYYGLSIRPVTD